MYMSYCKFEGTLDELKVCLNDVDEHVSGEAEDEVSDEEIRHFRNMVEYFVGWLNDQALLDEDGCLDYDELDKVCEAMEQSYQEEEEEDE